MASLSFQPSGTEPFAVGDTVTFTLVGADLPAIAGVFFDLTYDASVLSYQGAAFDDRLDFPVDRDEPTDANGVITLENIQSGAFNNEPAGEFTVATLTFNVVGTGDSSVDIAPRGSDGQFFVDADNNAVDIEAPSAANVVVLPPNTIPVATDDVAVTNEDEAITLDVLANDIDPDDDALTITSVGVAANGQVVNNGDGTLTYIPADDFNGTDSFTYTVDDGRDGTATATVDVEVLAVNDAPQALDDAASTSPGEAVTIDVLDNDVDVDGDLLTLVGLEGATNGELINNGNGTVTYIPGEDFTGVDSFEYTVTDSSGATDTASVFVDVASSEPESNDFWNWWYGLNSGGQGQGTIAVANDDDVAGRFGWQVKGNLFADNGAGADQVPEGGAVTSIAGQAVEFGSEIMLTSGATVVVQENGDFAYDQGAAFASADSGSPATDSFEYTLANGQGESSSAVVSVDLGDVKDTVSFSAVEALYQVAFDRQADAGGLEYWTGVMEEGNSLFDIADFFVGSEEFSANNGDDVSDEAFLTLLYDHAFERTPDAGGLEYWTGVLEEGLADEGEVMAHFASSDEMQTKYLAEGFVFA